MSILPLLIGTSLANPLANDLVSSKPLPDALPFPVEDHREESLSVVAMSPTHAALQYTTAPAPVTDTTAADCGMPEMSRWVRGPTRLTVVELGGGPIATYPILPTPLPEVDRCDALARSEENLSIAKAAMTELGLHLTSPPLPVLVTETTTRCNAHDYSITTLVVAGCYRIDPRENPPGCNVHRAYFESERWDPAVSAQFGLARGTITRSGGPTHTTHVPFSLTLGGITHIRYPMAFPVGDGCVFLETQTTQTGRSHLRTLASYRLTPIL